MSKYEEAPLYNYFFKYSQQEFHQTDFIILQEKLMTPKRKIHEDQMDQASQRDVDKKFELVKLILVFFKFCTYNFLYCFSAFLLLLYMHIYTYNLFCEWKWSKKVLLCFVH